MRKQLPTYLFFGSFFIFFITIHGAFAQQNLDSDKRAAAGYDVVAYFNNTPTAGNSNFQVEYKDAIYQFKNQSNMALFEMNPTCYVPQYGGWCAYAMGSNGEKVEINPESYSIEDKKLYLFYKTTFTDTKKKWMKKNTPLKLEANQNWNKWLNN
jgi:hypothetical protein